MKVLVIGAVYNGSHFRMCPDVLDHRVVMVELDGELKDIARCLADNFSYGLDEPYQPSSAIADDIDRLFDMPWYDGCGALLGVKVGNITFPHHRLLPGSILKQYKEPVHITEADVANGTAADKLLAPRETYDINIIDVINGGTNPYVINLGTVVVGDTTPNFLVTLRELHGSNPELFIDRGGYDK